MTLLQPPTIFLDIDGVLVTYKNQLEAYERHYCIDIQSQLKDISDYEYKDLTRKRLMRKARKASGEKFPHQEVVEFSKDALFYIHQLYEQTNCQFVISSDWRKDRTLEELTSHLTSKGLKVPIIGKTSESNYIGYRGVEIQEYIDTYNVQNYIVLDDIRFRHFDEYFGERFIQTKRITGFSQENLQQALTILI